MEFFPKDVFLVFEFLDFLSPLEHGNFLLQYFFFLCQVVGILLIACFCFEFQVSHFLFCHFFCYDLSEGFQEA